MSLFQTVAALGCWRLGSSAPAAARRCLGGRVHGWERAWEPPEAVQRETCNCGYAPRGAALIFPTMRARMPWRFSMAGERLIYIFERDHTPVEHGKVGGATEMREPLGQLGPCVSRKLWQGYSGSGCRIRRRWLIWSVDARKHDTSLDMTRVRGNAHEGHSAKGLRRHLVDLQAIALLQHCPGDEARERLVHGPLAVESEGSRFDFPGHIVERPALRPRILFPDRGDRDCSSPLPTSSGTTRCRAGRPAGGAYSFGPRSYQV